MDVGYHNHWWEFDHEIDGQTPYAWLQQLVDPSVFMQLDIYWAKFGGHEPADVITSLGTRVRMLHVKDGPLQPPSPMTAVGEGKVDIAGALGASSDVQWHVVELDECATDMFDAVEASYRFLVGNGLSSGR
jgi:sugar phosphate isomerase/epimerase